MPNQTPDLIPYLFLAAVIIVGGFVAYVADGLGRKMGKKRLSLFGLRPRHTATVITVGAGILIPILTIGAIFALSSEVREWIREGRSAIERAKTYQQEATERAGDVKRLEGKEKELVGRNTKLTDQAKKLNQKLTEYEAQVKTADQNLRTAQAKASEAQRRAQGLQGQLTATNRRIRTVQSEIQTTLKSLNAGKKQLSDLKGSYNEASKQLDENKKRADELDRQNVSLEKKLGSLQTELGGLQGQKLDFETQISSLRQSISTYQESIRNYTRWVNELRQESDRLSGLLQNNITFSRTKPLIYDSTEELARIQVQPSLSPVAARNAYFDLLQRARTEATKRGAADSGLRPQELSNPPRIVGTAEQEDAIIRGITAQRTELVMVARSAFNAFEGEFVLLEFVAYRNRLVYTTGKVIAETKIDGRREDVEIFNSIQQFVGQNVRAQALKDGMIPVSGRNGGLGQVENDDLLGLIRSVRSENMIVRVQAVAKRDTKAGDQLELEFRIRY